MIKKTNEIKETKQANVDNIMKEINNVCDKIHTFVESLRKNLLQQVRKLKWMYSSLPNERSMCCVCCTMKIIGTAGVFQQVTWGENTENRNLVASVTSLEKLLKLVESTHSSYDASLTYASTHTGEEMIDTQSILNKNELNKKLDECKNKYEQHISSNLDVISKSTNICVLRYNLNELKQIVANQLIKVDTQKANNQLSEKLSDRIKFLNSKDNSPYLLCQFDSKYTILTDKSTIDHDNKHIKLGLKGDGYAMMLPDKQHMQGYKSGQHCFRMYYKNQQGARGPSKWLLFDIYKYDTVPKDVHTCDHETCWGTAHGILRDIICNGKGESDK